MSVSVVQMRLLAIMHPRLARLTVGQVVCLQTAVNRTFTRIDPCPTTLGREPSLPNIDETQEDSASISSGKGTVLCALVAVFNLSVQKPGTLN